MVYSYGPTVRRVEVLRGDRYTSCTYLGTPPQVVVGRTVRTETSVIRTFFPVRKGYLLSPDRGRLWVL